jgi:hypothetical protein
MSKVQVSGAFEDNEPNQTSIGDGTNLQDTMEMNKVELNSPTLEAMVDTMRTRRNCHREVHNQAQNMNTKTPTTKTLMDCASYCIMKLHDIKVKGRIKSDKLGVNDSRIEHGSSIRGHGDNGGLQLNGWIKSDKIGVNNGRIEHGSSINGHGDNGGLQLNELGKNDGDNEGLKLNEIDMDESCIVTLHPNNSLEHSLEGV